MIDIDGGDQDPRSKIGTARCVLLRPTELIYYITKFQLHFNDSK